MSVRINKLHLQGSIVQGVNANHGVSNIPIGIGEGAVIKKAIVDKNARIGKNVLVLFLINHYTLLLFVKQFCNTRTCVPAALIHVFFDSKELLMPVIYFSYIMLQIINKDNVQEGDKEANGYVIRKGIIIIIERAIISDGTIL